MKREGYLECGYCIEDGRKNSQKFTKAQLKNHVRNEHIGKKAV